MRVLIVEDEARIASFLVKGLGSRGYGVEHVDTGAEALERVRAGGAYGLVLLDLGLPDMEGLDVLRRLRERSRSLPVIVLTSHAADRERGLELGADDYLTKPLPFDRLLERVRALR
jgi:two-component system, OmpR family, copper resistance phosphate regulon response regulator CusR